MNFKIEILANFEFVNRLFIKLFNFIRVLTEIEIGRVKSLVHITYSNWKFKKQKRFGKLWKNDKSWYQMRWNLVQDSEY